MSMARSDNVSEGAQAWCTDLMRLLYDERPRFCDVEIECTASKDSVYAHRTVLAARTQYFYQAFLSNIPGSDVGQTLAVQASPSGGPADALTTSPSGVVEDTSSIMGPNAELRRVGKVVFKETSDVLQRIVEFMYLGQIRMLEDTAVTPSAEQANIWQWLLTWAFKHKVVELFKYIICHLLRMQLSPGIAARLLDLQVESASSRCSGPVSGSVGASMGVPDDDRSDYLLLLDRLRAHAADCFNREAFHEQIFETLNRAALIVVLQECRFSVPELEVIKAVRYWVRNSEWVRSSYDSSAMPPTAVHTIMQYVDVRCLTPPEFFEFEDMFSLEFIDLFTDQMYRVHKADSSRKRMADSAVCEDRSRIHEFYHQLESGTVEQSLNGASASTVSDAPAPAAVSPAVVSPSPPAPRPPIAPGQPHGHGTHAHPARKTHHSRDSRSDVTHIPAPGLVQIQPQMGANGSSQEVLAAVDRGARGDYHRPESAFIKGTKMFLKHEGGLCSLVSLESSTYQGMMYRGTVKGTLRWRLEVVRRCDMFWMGVTSNHGLDMSGMVARDRHVWMVSEEGTCMEHCRPAAVTRAQSVKARINLLFVDCFKCLPAANDAWDNVVMELDSRYGNLYISINGSELLHVFQNLPTDRPLYPCLMAVNTGQAHFELLDAQQL